MASSPEKKTHKRRRMAFLGGVFQHLKMPFVAGSTSEAAAVASEPAIEESAAPKSEPVVEPEQETNSTQNVDQEDGLIESKPPIEIAITETTAEQEEILDDAPEPGTLTDVSAGTDVFEDANSDLELHLPNDENKHLASVSANTTATEYFNAQDNSHLEEATTPVREETDLLNTSAELIEDLVDQVERQLNLDETALLAATPLAKTVPSPQICELSPYQPKTNPQTVQETQPEAPIVNGEAEEEEIAPRFTSSPTPPVQIVMETEQISPRQEVNTNTFTKSQARAAKPLVQQKLRASANQTAVVAPLVAGGDVDQQNVISAKQTVTHAAGDGEDFVMASNDMLNDPNALDFLQNAGGDYTESEHYRESLYVKFDPLVAKSQTNASTTNGDATPVQENMPDFMPEGDNLVQLKTPSPRPNDSKQKTPSTVVIKKHQRMADSQPEVDVDHLLKSFPEDSSLDGLVDDALKSLQATAGNPNLDEVAQRLRLQFQAVLLAKEREWSSKLHKQEQRADRLANDLKNSKRDCDQAKQNTSEMTVVVAEYEKTMRQLMTELDALKKHKVDDVDHIIRERDQAVEDLQSVENSFADLHRRYEKLRQSTEDFKKNEDKLKSSLNDCESKLKRSEDKFHKLREHAEDKLDKANHEIERLNRARENDTLALRAQLKKRELQVETLEKSLETKQKEIHELTAICDELIQKAGAGAEI